ncbi:hypothetical protein QO010_002881 [Caulobacter ginsengisoli]|uniref:Uncharacterized protein n=1 Tax=Caulobacter ginsengisoli TaxID=400775 RepID=A0ABU0ISW4_9CAUL|nr:hypothetical protein [Caulobacter ginsengisoli]MDQ0465097.1 hypothetical protein [Caulobacter ginsengisoli]
MSLDLNFGKLLGFSALLWLVLIVALLADPGAWTAWQVTAFFVFPVICTAILWAIARRDWRLEAIPHGLIHHTLGRTERFDWRAMGPFTVKGLPIGPKVLEFPYPAQADGSGPPRRLLLVFGDQSGAQTAVTLERFRRLYLRAPQAPEPVDATIRLAMSWFRLFMLLRPAFLVVGIGAGAAMTWLPGVDVRLLLFGVIVLSVAAVALVARLHSLTLGDHALVLTGWGRETEISWIAIEEVRLVTGGVWPFRLPVLALTWRGDAPPFHKTRIGDLYGDWRLEDLLPLIDERRIAAFEAINADEPPSAQPTPVSGR